MYDSTNSDDPYSDKYGNIIFSSTRNSDFILIKDKQFDPELEKIIEEMNNEK